MSPDLQAFLTICAFVISLLALTFTFLKDAHRIRLEMLKATNGNVLLNINNDASFEATIISIGYVTSAGKWHWFSDSVLCHHTNTGHDLPLRISARSMFDASLHVAQHELLRSSRLGLGVQLATGRVYVVMNRLPFGTAVRYQGSSLISRLSAGRFAPGFYRPRKLWLFVTFSGVEHWQAGGRACRRRTGCGCGSWRSCGIRERWP